MSAARARQRADPSGDEGPGLCHDALVYGSDEDYLAHVVPFVLEALAGGEAVSVITTPHNGKLLRDALGPEAGNVQIVDGEGLSPTPARKLALLDQEGAARVAAEGAWRVRIVGEADFGAGTTDEQFDWLRYEAVLNRVFEASPRWFLCAYDRRTLPEWVADAAPRTHPHIGTSGERHASDRYEDPETLARELAPPPPEPDGEPVMAMDVDVDRLGAARGALEQLVHAVSTSQQRAIEVAIGINEVVTNALEHGGDHAYVRCWLGEGHLTCEVVDEGPGLDDPFAGYWPPSPEQVDGRGLWLARQTIDTVELRPAEQSGLRVLMATSL